uniref:14-3-3 domain-containing protein n=1 Tax=Lactuca sativa TaxID=4236 RepID=A0A9R1XI46_LACSA|nr:hypothetical protein LSAT_V11C400218690 [Lactuca sativa]
MIKVSKLGVETDYGIKESAQLGTKIRKRDQEVMVKMQKVSGVEYRQKWNHNSISFVMMIISFIHMVVLVIRCILLQDSGNDKKDVDISMKSYEVATTTTKAELPPTFPIRLGHTLNFSVFYYKVMNSA